MEDKLLVRVYNVGFGDCIFVKVPDTYKDPDTGEERVEHRHILIDCGSTNMTGLGEPRRRALEDVYSMLGEERRLDLLVVTHKHSDHLNGFDLKWKCLTDMKIERIWLSAAMNKNHLGAKEYWALQDLELKTLNWLDDSPLGLSVELRAIREDRVSVAKALHNLTGELPELNGIDPMYVYQGFERDDTDNKYLLQFKEDKTKLWVLAPEWNIDGFYLDRELLDSLRDLNGHAGHLSQIVPENWREEQWPINQHRAQLWDEALRYSERNNTMDNCTSVVLLLEWRSYRLLFTGDAECRSWEVMWDRVQDKLAAPLDFLKVAHHGSLNGTPLNEIVDTILPWPPDGHKATGYVVVLTKAPKDPDDWKVKWDPTLMKELGRRAANRRKYKCHNEPELYGEYQPQRTDLEFRKDCEELQYVEITFPPAPG